MTKTTMDLTELLQKHDQGDLLRSIAEAVLQLIMEADVDGLIGAGRHERNGDRTTWRNGYRDRSLDTRLGTLNLRVPKLRQGSYFPGFLEARKTSEQALVAVIQGKRLVNPPCRGSILGDSVHYRVMDIIGVFCGEASPASNVE